MNDESLYIYGATLMMVIGTFSCRELPLLLLRGRKLPDWFSIWLKYIPTAIFGALIFPDIFLKDNALNFTLQNYGAAPSAHCSPRASGPRIEFPTSRRAAAR